MTERCVCCGEIIPEGRQVCLLCEKGEVRMSKNDRCPMDIGVRTTCARCMAGAPYHQCCRLECHQHEFCRGCQWNPDLEGGDRSMKADWIIEATNIIQEGTANKLVKDNITVYKVGNDIRIDIKGAMLQKEHKNGSH